MNRLSDDEFSTAEGGEEAHIVGDGPARTLEWCDNDPRAFAGAPSFALGRAQNCCNHLVAILMSDNSDFYSLEQSLSTSLVVTARAHQKAHLYKQNLQKKSES